ncbi:Dyp-type peroxidase [Microbacterium sp. bgisy203]|uniref:Dyp-type peroxidase n=1 Tax=Microbacterium sp. bgisy203 TaxID=3413799 RepID=UPI003D712A2B
MSDSAQRRVPIEPQRVDAPLTSNAIMLTLTLTSAPDAVATVRSALASVGDLVKNVAVRDLSGALACTVGIGSDVWDAVTGAPRPAELHPFREVRGAVHTAPSTPGDLFVHIRAERHDLCFELERQILDAFGGAVAVADETVGFRYFDARDLLGFVDGTANPVGDALPASTLIGAEDPAGEGGSYLVVQKYVHDMGVWRAHSTETQEAIIGRTKLDNVELDDAAAPDQKSHKTLSTITDDAGVEHDILRDNMPFGSPAHGEFGTYFIGYARELWVIERMLERMFIGDPPGKHDRILDASSACTGSVFFIPPPVLLESLGA